MQVIAVMTPALNLPDWVDSFFAVLLIAGFPIALLFAWAFELTPEGVKRTTPVHDKDGIRGQTGRKLDFAILGGLGLVAALVIGTHLFSGSTLSPDATPVVTTEKQTPVAAAGTSIAVLPFADMSQAGDQEYFSDGMAEEILNALVKVPDLRVTGRTSSFSFKGKNIDIREIGKALNVAHVLEGSVRKQGNAVRITAQLIKSEDGVHLWSETYDGTLDNIFDLQEEVSRAIAEELQVLLSVGKNVRIAAKLTDSTEAYELFLRGRKKSSQFWEDGSIQAGIDLLEQAVSLDPNFTEAWVNLARAYSSLAVYSAAADDKLSSAASRRAAFKALAIDPEHGPAQNTLLILDWLSGKLSETTDEYYKREAEFGDDLNYVFYRGYSAMAFGQTRSASQYLEKALTLDPLRSDTLYNLGILSLYLGDFEQARDYAERAKAIGFSAAAITEAEILEAEGKSSDAAEAFLKAYDEFGSQYSVELRSRSLWEIYGKAVWGGDEAAKSQTVSFITQTLAQSDGDINQTMIGALVNLGEVELFFEAYDRVGISNFEVLISLWNPYREGAMALRQHPEFPKFAERIGLLKIWQTHGWPDLCKPISGTDGSGGQFTCA